jgi:aspartyl-tRNA synthetase
MHRTYKLDEINEKLIGKSVTLAGWVDTIRDHNNVLFIDLRDRYGKVQCVILKKNEDFEVAKNLTVESCVKLTGTVGARPKGSENEELSSGKVEVKMDKLEVLSVAGPLPYAVNNDDVNEETKMEFKYLDLRGEKMKRNLMKRHKAISFIRQFLDDEGFMEIQTPILTKSSPEGARDFLVPSRNHPGKFYALPQSPQQYKQLLMVGGIDKYFQIVPCFRDEDARADRCPGEFYQLDMEMSFFERDDVLDLYEKLIIAMVKEVFPEKHITKVPFPRIPYDEAMKKYGNDKPDIRKDKKDADELGFCFVIDFPLFKAQKEEDYFHGAGERWGPSHHMFTMVKEEDKKFLTDKDAGKAKAYQYDLALNGFEVAGGSVRIHDPEVQKKIFDLIGFKKEQAKEFEHMLTAFGYGVPPHAGIAGGLDRMLMVLCGASHIRDVIAFPKNKEARDVLMGAPSVVDKSQLDEVHIGVKKVVKGKGGKK